MRFLLLTSVGSALVLWVAATPGLFMGGLLCPCFSVCVFAGAVSGWLIVGALTCNTAKATARVKKYVIAAIVAGLVTILLTLSDAPMYVGLWACAGEFETLLSAAPQARTEPLGWVGCYYVDRYGADDSGGVFFRTASHPDGIGPDTMSYGFAYRPHQESCPFGQARYQTGHLFGDWYWFKVSDD